MLFMYLLLFITLYFYPTLPHNVGLMVAHNTIKHSRISSINIINIIIFLTKVPTYLEGGTAQNATVIILFCVFVSESFLKPFRKPLCVY